MSKAAELAALIGSGQAQGNKNLIINGAMNVAQRGTSATGLGSGGTFTYNSQDRWYFLTVGSAAARFTQTVSTDVPDNTDFSTSLKLECTTASGTVGAAHRQQIGQKLEAQNNQALRYGKSNAKSATLSFWVKATKTGKNYAWLYAGDASKFSYISYTINTSNTWEYKTVTFTGDTAASIANDNGEGLSVIWMLYLGSDYTSDSSGSENTWIAWNSSNYDQFHGQVNHADSTSNSFLITGTQLEIGEVATAFEHEDIGTTLAKCQRYFHRFQSDTAYDAFAPAYWLVTTQVYSMYEFPVTMRTQPSLAISATSDWRIHSNGGDGVLGSLVANRNTPNNMQTYSDQSSNTGTAGHAGAIRNNNTASAYIEFNAEL